MIEALVWLIRSEVWQTLKEKGINDDLKECKGHKGSSYHIVQNEKIRWLWICT